MGTAAPELAAVVRTPLEPRQSVEAEVLLDAGAWARWSERAGAVQPVDGTHTLLLGQSASALRQSSSIHIAEQAIAQIE